MSFVKVEPYQGVIHQGCLNCPPIQKLASLNMLIAVGFGMAQVTCDDELVFNEGYDQHHYSAELGDLLWQLNRAEGLPILGDIEELARNEPDHNWIVALVGPLRERTYQRHGPGQWVLIDSGKGFA